MTPREQAGTPEDSVPPEVMTVNEVAAALRVSRATFYRLVGAGALAGTRIGRSVRVTRRAVDEFVSGHPHATHEPHTA